VQKCSSIHSAISTELRLVTDIDTDRHRAIASTANMASRGKATVQRIKPKNMKIRLDRLHQYALYSITIGSKDQQKESQYMPFLVFTSITCRRRTRDGIML